MSWLTMPVPVPAWVVYLLIINTLVLIARSFRD
jgi:hypothetical protein